GGRRCEQDRQLEGNDDERGPAMQRPAADVQRVMNYREVILQNVSGNGTGNPPYEDNERQIVAHPDHIVEFLDRVRRVRLDAAVAAVSRRPRRSQKSIRVFELGDYAVRPRARHFSGPPPGFENGSNSRISNIEIMGKKRVNSRNRKMKSPIDPKIKE